MDDCLLYSNLLPIITFTLSIDMKMYRQAGSIGMTAVLIMALTAFLPLQNKDNTLSAAEKKAGWTLLFDGQTTNGWRAYNNKPSDGWEIVHGELHCKETGVQHRADLMTVDEYGDFELTVDWKVGKGANSGIIYRSVEGNGASYETGPEYQLIDDNGYGEKLEDWQKSGSDYAMHPPLKVTAKPVGEYNHTKIIVKGAHAEHWLNGEKVVSFDFWTPEWNELKAKSKWKDAKDYGMAKKGHIALQDHGGGIWFKNIKIRKL
jgi:hypothetical protein